MQKLVENLGVFTPWFREQNMKMDMYTIEGQAALKKAFGKNLSNIMYEKHITQAKMARELGIPKTTVSSWMNGRRTPRSAAIKLLCRYLQCTHEELLNGFTGPAETTSVTAIPTDSSVSENMLFAALDACGYGNLRDLFAAAMTARQEEIDIATKMLKSQHGE